MCALSLSLCIVRWSHRSGAPRFVALICCTLHRRRVCINSIYNFAWESTYVRMQSAACVRGGALSAEEKSSRFNSRYLIARARARLKGAHQHQSSEVDRSHRCLYHDVIRCGKWCFKNPLSV